MLMLWAYGVSGVLYLNPKAPKPESDSQGMFGVRAAHGATEARSPPSCWPNGAAYPASKPLQDRGLGLEVLSLWG